MTQYLLPFVLMTLAVGQQAKPSDKSLFDSSGITSNVGTMLTSCDEGTKVVIPIRGGGEDVIAICHDNYYERVPPAQCPKGMICQSVPDLYVAAPASQPAQTPVSTFCAGEPDGNMFSINGKSYTCKDGQLMPAAQTPAKPSVTYGCIGDVDAVKAACPDQAPITCVGKWKFRKPKGWQCVVTSPPARKPASRECQPTTTVQDGR